MQDSQDFHDFMMATCISTSVHPIHDSIRELDEIIMEDLYVEVDNL